MATAVALLRFDEELDNVRPADAIGNLDELTIEAGLVAPPVVDAALGRGRGFASTAGRGYRTTDIVAGSTLLTRDPSIQAELIWDLTAPSASGGPGTIYARGKGTAAAEYVGAGLELRVVNAALQVGELRWLWHDVAGVLKTQIGGHFQPPASGFMLLTATRRWVSSNEVVLRYYAGDQLLAEVTSVDGSIGGGTTGTTSIGARFAGAWGRFLDGVVDELRVVGYELTPEEVAATWKRITLHQPSGYTLLQELHDPGFPISADPGSRVQRETRQWGHALGYAAAQAENVRDNVLPDRAYADVLSSWEAIAAQPPRPGDSVDARRARVVARMRQHAGISIPGVKAALRELVATDPDNLQIIAFDQTTVDNYGATGLNTLRWLYDAAAQWTIAAGALRVQNAASIPFDGSNRSWLTARMSIGGNGRAARVLAKVVPTTLAPSTEVGVWFGDWAAGNLTLLGYRNIVGTFQIVTESFLGWASSGVTIRGTLGGLVTAWLHLAGQDLAGAVGLGGSLSKYTAAWATAAEAGPYTSVVDIDAGFTGAQWAGLYARTLAGAANIDVSFDDVRVRAPYGDRSFRLYVYRDPALAGRPDLVGGNNVLAGLKQAHTAAKLVTAKGALCDDANTTCDSTPMGAI